MSESKHQLVICGDHINSVGLGGSPIDVEIGNYSMSIDLDDMVYGGEVVVREVEVDFTSAQLAELLDDNGLLFDIVRACWERIDADDNDLIEAFRAISGAPNGNGSVSLHGPTPSVDPNLAEAVKALQQVANALGELTGG